ncbi:hypothetical protein GCM10022271_26550 [Corallibacter vietnamensis]|uniref:HNH endonuclease n=1 Tax=Corallibacter vietnamensis TaxID=904130 RepID=A0ABP7HFD8_9FLAO
MAITDKTRKALWAKSGNRCILCRIELVQEVESSNSNLIIGQECHIVSEKGKGPRANPSFKGNYDDYNNLMLLCANDHKRIDDLTEIYTTEKLLQFKQNHENWVRTTLEKDVTAFANDQENIRSLPLIKSGKQLLDIINGVHMSDFDNEELNTIEEAEKVGNLFDLLKDYIDILEDMRMTDIAKLGIELNGEIAELKEMGFLVFGTKRHIKLRGENFKDLGAFETASIVIVRKDNPSIVSDFLIAKFSNKMNFGF